MTATTRERDKDRRDSLLLLLLIILLGFFCIFFASGWALRFSPSWSVPANMESKLDPSGDFLTNIPSEPLQPLNPAILTNASWIDIFLTPGATIPTRPANPTAALPSSTSTPLPTNTATSSPLPPTATVPSFPTAIPTKATNTSIPSTPVLSATPTLTLTPTNTSVPLPSTDLQITKTDGSATYIPGTSINYTITVSNAGPANATGASITDAIPAAIIGATINCVASGTASCGTNASAGNNLLFTGISLPAGAANFLTVTVSGTVNSAAVGNLVNSATVIVGAGQVDPSPGNNTATDTDTRNAQTDLSITKTDGTTVYTPGNSITYTIQVLNAGPSNAVGASVTDTIPAAITGVTINCLASGTASCGTGASTGNNLLFTGVNIPVGGTNFLTITINGTIDAAATGNLDNTASVAAGAGQTDTNSANNSATDTDTQYIPSADLQITKTDGVAGYTPGGSLTYTIVVSNPTGPDAVTGATVTDTLPAPMTGGSWTCSGANGGVCSASGIGSINDAVDLPVGASVTYSLSVNISSATVGGLTNAATVAVPLGFTDLNAANNTASDTDTSSSSTEPGIGGPNGSSFNPGRNGSITIVFTPAIVTDGTSNPDFVYYEVRAGGPWVDLDWVKVEISSD